MTPIKAPLGKFVKVVGGYAFKSEHFAEYGTPVIRISDIQDGQVSIDKAAKIPSTLIGKGQHYIVEAGDILIAMSGATTGKIGLAPTGLCGLVLQNQRVGNFKITSPEKIHTGYLKHLVCSTNYQKQVCNLMAGAAQPNISASQLESIEVPVPPLPEQRRIAAILDQADELQAKRREALALVDELQRGIFIEMFGDPITNHKRWPIACLGAVADFYAGNSLPEGVPFVGQKDGYLLMKVSDMNLAGNERLVEKCQLWSKVSGARSATCPAKSIVIPKRGGAIGTNKKRMTVRPTVLDPNLMAVFAKGSLLPDYLFQWFMGFDLSSIASGSSVPQLNKQDLAPLEIQTPPAELQKIFGERCRKLEVLKSDAKTALSWTERLFSSLQHRAFRGEL